MATFLVALGDAKGARWVIAHEAMAFTPVGARKAARLSHGDTILFYLSKRCLTDLGLRGLDGGLVVGSAVVLTDVRALKQPTFIGGRRFEQGCHVFFENLAPLGKGVSLKALSNSLVLLAGRPNYGQALRQTPVALHEHDAALLCRQLESVVTAFDEAKSSYFEDPGNAIRISS